MKQHVSSKQLGELSEKGKERLRKWWKKSGIHEGDLVVGPNKTSNDFLWLEEHLFQGGKLETSYPLLSIGQMVEFLDEKFKYLKLSHEWGAKRLGWRVSHIESLNPYKPKNFPFSYGLVDALWEAVREVLEASA